MDACGTDAGVKRFEEEEKKKEENSAAGTEPEVAGGNRVSVMSGQQSRALMILRRLAFAMGRWRTSYSSSRSTLRRIVVRICFSGTCLSR